MNTTRADISPKILIDYLFLQVPLHLNHSYDHNGIDAFGNSRECYFYIPSWDESDNPMDAGEQAYLSAANAYLQQLQRPERITSCSIDGDLKYVDNNKNIVTHSLNKIDNTTNRSIVLEDIPF